MTLQAAGSGVCVCVCVCVCLIPQERMLSPSDWFVTHPRGMSDTGLCIQIHFGIQDKRFLWEWLALIKYNFLSLPPKIHT